MLFTKFLGSMALALLLCAAVAVSDGVAAPSTVKPFPVTQKNQGKHQAKHQGKHQAKGKHHQQHKHHKKTQPRQQTLNQVEQDLQKAERDVKALLAR